MAEPRAIFQWKKQTLICLNHQCMIVHYRPSNAIPDSSTYMHVTGSTWVILFEGRLKDPQFFSNTVFSLGIIHSLEIRIKMQVLSEKNYSLSCQYN